MDLFISVWPAPRPWSCSLPAGPYIYAYIYIHIYTYTYTYMVHISMCKRMDLFISVWPAPRPWSCSLPAGPYIYIYIYMHIYTHMYPYPYTYIVHISMCKRMDLFISVWPAPRPWSCSLPAGPSWRRAWSSQRWSPCAPWWSSCRTSPPEQQFTWMVNILHVNGRHSGIGWTSFCIL